MKALPPAWSFQYQRLGFIGLVLLIVVMRAAPGFLNWWFGPAEYVGSGLRFAVRSLLTPTYYSWMT